MNKPSQELIRKTFSYDPDEPLALRWKTTKGSIKVGTIAGYWHPTRAKSSNLTRYVSFGEFRREPVHHVVWIYFHGFIPNAGIKFIDGNKGNCRIENLSEKEKLPFPPKSKEIRKIFFKRWRASHNHEEWQKYILNRNLKRDYGISIEHYISMEKKQNGVCAICKLPETLIRRGRVERLSVDHCHEGGRIRGLLCSNCNNGLGRFRDDPTRLRAAADYLEKHKITSDDS